MTFCEQNRHSPCPHGARSLAVRATTAPCKQGLLSDEDSGRKDHACGRMRRDMWEEEGLPAQGQEGGSLTGSVCAQPAEKTPRQLHQGKRDPEQRGQGLPVWLSPISRACSTWAGTTSLSAQFQGEDFNGTRYRSTKGQ